LIRRAPKRRNGDQGRPCRNLKGPLEAQGRPGRKEIPRRQAEVGALRQGVPARDRSRTSAIGRPKAPRGLSTGQRGAGPGFRSVSLAYAELLPCGEHARRWIFARASWAFRLCEDRALQGANPERGAPLHEGGCRPNGSPTSVERTGGGRPKFKVFGSAGALSLFQHAEIWNIPRKKPIPFLPDGSKKLAKDLGPRRDARPRCWDIADGGYSEEGGRCGEPNLLRWSSPDFRHIFNSGSDISRTGTSFLSKIFCRT